MKQNSYTGPDRRSKPKEKDRLVIITLIGNVLVWCMFVIAMILFHIGKPELVTGVQKFWGVEGREHWLSAQLFWLTALLTLCITLSVILLFLRKLRSRRKNESIAANLVFLALIAGAFLVWVYQMMP